MATDFTLDPTLSSDTHAIGELDLCSLVLMNDARFLWAILVPRIAGVSELYELSRGDRSLLMEEIVQVSEAVEAQSGCKKINVATFGNQVRQLHVHVMARHEDDEAWPSPVWGVGTAQAYELDKAQSLITSLARALSIQPRLNVV